MKKFQSWAFILGAFAWCGSAAARIEVHGHRGARAVLPENSLPAFEHALEVGVDVIELDLVVSKDGKLVVAHDPELNPVICLGPGGRKLETGPKIRSLLWTELQLYDCGSLKNPRFPKQVVRPGTRMPSIEQVFDLVKTSRFPAAKTVRFNIEAKSVPHRPDLTPEPEEFARLIVRAIQAAGLTNRAIVQSFDHRVLPFVKKLDSKIQTSALVSDCFVLDWVGVLRAAKADILSPDAGWIDRNLVTRLHGFGLKVVPWTVNDPEGWQRMIDYKVDGIITDDPAALITFLRLKGLR